jgi:multicomponent K+:H+ antiporter subunit E
MKRPPLLLILTLFAIWLLLAGSWSAGQIALGATLAVVLGLASRSMRPLQPRLRRPHLAVGLILRVLLDIVRSNIGVGRVVLGLIRDRPVRSGFLKIPLELHDPHGLAALAMIVTSTPGTIWAGMSPDGATLTLHVLDLRDEQAMIQMIKERYERPLMELFQ